MGRSDHFAGLPESASLFLKENELPPIICPTCNQITGFNWVVIDHYWGMFGDRYDLLRRRLKDGGYADDFLQATPWSGGPVFFLGLRVYDKEGNLRKIFVWPDETINNV